MESVRRDELFFKWLFIGSVAAITYLILSWMPVWVALICCFIIVMSFLDPGSWGCSRLDTIWEVWNKFIRKK